MASTRLTRTPSTAGNRRTWTFSAWIKRSKITADQQIFVGDSPRTWIVFLADDKLQVFVQQDFQLDVKTNMLFRDTSAWYHIVVGVDTTQASQNDRVKIYVNGSLVDVTNSYAVQNFDTGVNNTGEHYIGRLNYADSSYFNGLMSHIHLCDGTQYQASDFGQYDANGVWTIKTSPSVTYGTNGFFILKDGNSVTDQSGNSNNWTVASGTLTNTEDNPSNVFCTINPLIKVPNQTYANGNTKVTDSDGAHKANYGNIGFSSGKYYWEAKAIQGSNNSKYTIGLSDVRNTYNYQQVAGTNLIVGNQANSYISGDAIGWYSTEINKNGSQVVGSIAQPVDGDIMMVACDADNGKIYFGRNGTWRVANSTTFDPDDNDTTFTTGESYFPAFSNENTSWETNFGNGYFGTTAVASAGTNASGIGIFEYDVPTGYTALSTKGLNE